MSKYIFFLQEPKDKASFEVEPNRVRSVFYLPHFLIPYAAILVLSPFKPVYIDMN